MNILFLTQVLPYPLDAGPKVRAYLVLRHLAESGHHVSLVSFIRDDDLPKYVEHLRSYCAEIRTVRMRRSRILDGTALVRALITGQPFLVARDWNPSMAHVIRNLARVQPSPDAVHADQLWMAPYALLARECARAGRRPLTVLDQHNAVFKIPKRLADSETSSWKRALLAREALKLARYERNICGKFDRVVWVTDQDRAALLGQGTDPTALPVSQVVIPIALDLSVNKPVCRRSDAHRVTFIGGLHWPPNARGVLWFQKEVWPQIRSQVPGAVLTIIGRNPLRQRWNGADSSVETTGYLADLTPYLAETAVFVVPLLAGGGMRVKILEAWSWGLPVVSTSIGAEGLDARHRENLCLADDPGSFAASVVEVMKNPELASQLTVGGRQTLESQYGWRGLYRAWDQVYQRAI